MKNEWTNPTIKKTCPACNELFRGDETVRGELCAGCDKKLFPCINCGEEFDYNYLTEEMLCPVCAWLK